MLEETSRKRFRVETLLRDAEVALEELDKLENDALVYKKHRRNLVRTSKEKAKAELSEKKETFDLRFENTEASRNLIKERFENIQEEIKKFLWKYGFIDSI